MGQKEERNPIFHLPDVDLGHIILFQKASISLSVKQE